MVSIDIYISDSSFVISQRHHISCKHLITVEKLKIPPALVFMFLENERDLNVLKETKPFSHNDVL